MPTGISWTDETWNPIRGCSRVSEGCRHCYAERVAARFSGPGLPYEGLVKIVNRPPPVPITEFQGRTVTEARWSGVVRMVPEHLADPLRWRKPRRIFVNSMSDLFHEALSNEQIAAIFGVMAAAPQHTFQVLTKRAKRMREWFAWMESTVENDAVEWSGRDCAVSIHDARRDSILEYLDDTALGHMVGFFDACHLGTTANPRRAWPLPNVHLGVSVENQAAAGERIPELLATPAAVWFISAEPLLGALDLTPWLYVPTRCIDCGSTAATYDTNPNQLEPLRRSDGSAVTCSMGVEMTGEPGALRCAACASLNVDEQRPLDWVIAGCESGSGARPCDVAWLRSLRDQCAAVGVPYFLKQAVDDDDDDAILPGPGSKAKAGGVIEMPYLDGVQHSAFPERAA